MDDNNYQILECRQWEKKLLTHKQLTEPYAHAFVERRSRGATHPVHDFLFTYYSFSPAKLKKWVPSYSDILEFDFSHFVRYPWLTHKLCSYDEVSKTLHLKKENISSTIKFIAAHIKQISSSILLRSPKFGCFGLHEWAMVYKLSQETIRHSKYPLRLSMKEIVDFVESQVLCCTHYDAYRFFTPEARPLNIVNPTIDKKSIYEQGGCLHANMDLYKWATKLWPWVGSDFIAKTFFHALEGRELDMRASPYDLKKDGYEAIPIETEEGRKQYQKEQVAYAEKSVELRKELVQFCTYFLRDTMDHSEK